MSSERRIILFGGSFDPVHLGHIEILRYVHTHIGADKSILIPARRSPLKPNAPTASNAQRFDMLKLAIEGIDDFEVSDIEFNLSEPSYSYHTISHFKELYGTSASLYWLAGADVAGDLHRWYKIEEILKMCEIILACRGGYDKTVGAFEHDSPIRQSAQNRITFIETPLIPISSTQIRCNIAGGLPIDGLTAPSVVRYIHNRNIYK